MFQRLLPVIYLSFISLGLPDSLLGAAWPSIYPTLAVPVSYAGIIATIISVGTVISSLLSDRLTWKLGTGKITLLSVGMTALALFGFSRSSHFVHLCLWAIPYGLGAGSVDAALNNYVALHYESRHMSWLHCMWGVGASIGPYIMGSAISGGRGWRGGYEWISLLQLVLTGILLFSLPLWKKRREKGPESDHARRRLGLREVLAIPGVWEILVCFFCYCSLEHSTGLWVGSYFNLARGVNAETAAKYAGLFYMGIMVGRAISGFLTFRLSDTHMIRLGQGIILLGLVVLFLPFVSTIALLGYLLIGLGCAPIYPSIIHSIPHHFGAEDSQAIIGMMMAGAYVGGCIMPPLFGFLSRFLGMAFFPIFLMIILVSMVLFHEKLLRKVGE